MRNPLLPCPFEHTDCFSNRGGLCRLLNNTDFNKKDCPFYATNEQVQESRQRSRNRLISIGASHLINYTEYKRGANDGCEQEEC